jgi:hypothetical protein
MENISQSSTTKSELTTDEARRALRRKMAESMHMGAEFGLAFFKAHHETVSDKVPARESGEARTARIRRAQLEMDAGI